MLQASIKKSVTKSKYIFGHCKPPQKNLKVCVVVPAKDEAENIFYTLDALRNQLHTNGSSVDNSVFEVLLLANNCIDGTLDIALRYAAEFPAFNLHVTAAIIPRKKANIGYVRRILMDEACRRLSLNGSTEGIIASTDGDTVVDKYWLSNIIQEIALGNDAVGGRILTNNIDPSARLYYLRDVTYRLLQAKVNSIIDHKKNNPWPCHHQYFGASLAVTCSMYNFCGRLPGVPHLEDMALYNALVKVDARVRCSPNVKVYTSGRTDGRVEVGFSEQLKQWVMLNNNHTPQMVEPAASLIIKLKAKKLLRKCYEIYSENKTIERNIVKVIAESLMIDEAWIIVEIATATFFGALWQITEDAVGEGDFYEEHPSVYIMEAIDGLRKFLKEN